MRPVLSQAFCDAPLREAVGSIAIESAYLERYVETMIYRLTKLSREMGYPIIEASMIGPKLALLEQVGKVKLKRRKKRAKEFGDIISEIRHSNADRVTAVHGIWMPEHVNYLKSLLEGQSRPPTIARKRNRDGAPDTTLGEKRAIKIAERISSLHHDLHEFAEEVWPALFPRVSPVLAPLALDDRPVKRKARARRT